MAKHRFDSSATPTSRLILLHEAVILTAQQIADVRKGKREATTATDFLLNATPAHIDVTSGLNPNEHGFLHGLVWVEF